jgi:hypothetical protein
VTALFPLATRLRPVCFVPIYYTMTLVVELVDAVGLPGLASTVGRRRHGCGCARLLWLSVGGGRRGRNFRYLHVQEDAPGWRTEEYKGSVRVPNNADAVTTVAVNPKSRPTASERGDHLPGRPPAPRSFELRQRALDPTVGPRTCSPFPNPAATPSHPATTPHTNPTNSEHTHWELLRFVGATAAGAGDRGGKPWIRPTKLLREVRRGDYGWSHKMVRDPNLRNMV